MFRDVNGREVYKAGEIVEKLNKENITNSYKVFIEDENFNIDKFFRELLSEINSLTNLNFKPIDVLSINTETGKIFNKRDNTKVERKDFFLKTFKSIIINYDNLYEEIYRRNQEEEKERNAIEDGLKELNEILNPDSVY